MGSWVGSEPTLASKPCDDDRIAGQPVGTEPRGHHRGTKLRSPFTPSTDHGFPLEPRSVDVELRVRIIKSIRSKTESKRKVYDFCFIF